MNKDKLFQVFIIVPYNRSWRKVVLFTGSLRQCKGLQDILDYPVHVDVCFDDDDDLPF